MSPVLYAAGVLVFLGALTVSIGLHELGHLLPAKAFGLRVTRYAVGLGPVLWRRRIGETTYDLGAVPVGGFVRIAGMLPPERAGGPTQRLPDAADAEDDDDGAVRLRRADTGLLSDLASLAREAEWDVVAVTEQHRLYYRAPWWQQVVVMAGGPVVNLALAFGCFWALFATYGNVQDTRAVPVVAEVAPCVPAAADAACTPGDPDSPARAAGVRPGDRLVEVGGRPAYDWAEVAALVRAHRGGPLPIVVERGGRRVELIAPAATATDADGVAHGLLGVVPLLEPATGGPGYTAEQVGAMTRRAVGVVASLPREVGAAGLAVLGLRERAPDGPVSVVGGGRIAGGIAADERRTVVDRAATLLALVGGLNLVLGVANLVPLLPLDGGRIAAALWQGLRGGLARLRRRPAPPPVDVARLLPLTLLVAGAVAVMTGVLVVADLVAPVPVG